MFLPRWVLVLFVATVLLLIVITTTVLFLQNDDMPNENESKSSDEQSIQPVTQSIQPSIMTPTSSITPKPKEENDPGAAIFQTISQLLKNWSEEPKNTSMASSPIANGLICFACLSIMDTLMKIGNTNSPSEVRDKVYFFCTLFKQRDEVCAGLIDLNLDILLYIFQNTKDLTPNRICGILLQNFECSANDPSLQWTIDVNLGVKPAANVKNHRKANTSNDLTIIQLTDIHYDPKYLPGGNAVCGEPMCCRSVQGSPRSSMEGAGYWGDFRDCDLPWHTIINVLQQVKKNHKKIDYIYMTGDIIDHAVWDTSTSANKDYIIKFMKQLKTDFPDIPVYPILGNHEPSPVNQYAPININHQNLSTNWLYKLVADQWSMWLPEETKRTILQGGFYTVLVRPGLRIIALNNNVCYIFNWWLIYNSEDPYGQLKWLAETLLEAEKNGEKVHILSHIPSGYSSCLRTWSNEFNNIIDRFESTITAQFNGHTHNDHFYIYYANEEPNHPTHVAFNGGSLTPYSDLNPNYKVYKVDSSTFNIVDAETWIFNLTEANLDQNKDPEWIKLYSFRDDYGMESLTPIDMDNLIKRMANQDIATNGSILAQYVRHYNKNSDPMLEKIYDENYMKDKLCEIVTFKMGDTSKCTAIGETFKGKENDIFGWINSIMMNFS